MTTSALAPVLCIARTDHGGVQGGSTGQVYRARVHQGGYTRTVQGRPWTSTVVSRTSLDQHGGVTDVLDHLGGITDVLDHLGGITDVQNGPRAALRTSRTGPERHS